MSLSFLLGLSSLIAVVYFGIFKGTHSSMSFIDPKSMIIVFGGTLAIAMISFQTRAVLRIVEFILWGVLFRRKRKYLKAANDMSLLRLNYMSGRAPYVDPNYDPLVKEGVEYLFDKSILQEGLVELLKSRAGYFSRFYKEDARVIQSLAKYPTALGFIAAAFGLIEGLQNFESLGMGAIINGGITAALAVAWGLGFANLILLPLADAAQKASQEDAMFRDLIIDGFRLIKEGVSDQQFRGHLRGYLSLEDRHNFHVLESNVKIVSNVLHEPEVEKETLSLGEEQIRHDMSRVSHVQNPMAKNLPKAPGAPVEKDFEPELISNSDYDEGPKSKVIQKAKIEQVRPKTVKIVKSKNDDSTEVIEPSGTEDSDDLFNPEVTDENQKNLNFSDYSQLRKKAK